MTPIVRRRKSERRVRNRKFPVFFPDSREFLAENSSRETASTAKQSRFFSESLTLSENPCFSPELAMIFLQAVKNSSPQILGKSGVFLAIHCGGALSQ
jgi:hypothetical protein